ncbi:MAG TPA: sensor histidine kinase [Candidatus Limnocylindrales bacterium]
MASPAAPAADGPQLTVAGPGGGRRRLRVPFVAATLFFTVFPFLSLLANPPQPAVLALLVAGWAIFAAVLVALFRGGPFASPFGGWPMVVAVVAMIAIAAVTQVVFRTAGGSALYFYAGVTAARLTDERLALGGIAAAGLVATLAIGIASADWSDGLVVGVTVATISLTLFSLARLGRANRELQAARRELADMAVAEERTRIARDLHDTLGHSLSLIALKSELARRVLPADPARAAAEIGDVERVARESLASVRETVSGYRQPTLAIELAGARTALRAAGIEGEVEPAPDGLSRDVDAVLGWAVREGVTNVLRHSEARSARIRVVADGATRAVFVEDDGHGGEATEGDHAPGWTGTGLTGLRERAAALGGTVEAGPVAGRGWRLHVAVPADRDATAGSAAT